MMLSEHFSLEEATFSSKAVRIGIDNTPDETVLHHMRQAAVGMEKVRYWLGHPVHVDSWFRCVRLNRSLGSKDTSAHVQGYAIDFICPQFGTPLEVCKKIVKEGIEFDQLIHEKKWVHISFDPKMRGEQLTADFNNGMVSYRKGLYL